MNFWTRPVLSVSWSPLFPKMLRLPQQICLLGCLNISIQLYQLNSLTGSLLHMKSLVMFLIWAWLFEVKWGNCTTWICANRPVLTHEIKNGAHTGENSVCSNCTVPLNMFFLNCGMLMLCSMNIKVAPCRHICLAFYSASVIDFIIYQNIVFVYFVGHHWLPLTSVLVCTGWWEFTTMMAG